MNAVVPLTAVKYAPLVRTDVHILRRAMVAPNNRVCEFDYPTLTVRRLLKVGYLQRYLKSTPTGTRLTSMLALTSRGTLAMQEHEEEEKKARHKKAMDDQRRGVIK